MVLTNIWRKDVKIVINNCFGGFGLSDVALGRYLELKGYPTESRSLYYADDGIRNDPILVQVVEELGDKASAKYSRLTVVEIPDDVEWTIEEYDGIESIHEIHRTWS